MTEPKKLTEVSEKLKPETFEEWWEAHRGCMGSKHTFAFDAWNGRNPEVAALRAQVKQEQAAVNHLAQSTAALLKRAEYAETRVTELLSLRDGGDA